MGVVLSHSVCASTGVLLPRKPLRVGYAWMETSRLTPTVPGPLREGNLRPTSTHPNRKRIVVDHIMIAKVRTRPTRVAWVRVRPCAALVVSRPPLARPTVELKHAASQWNESGRSCARSADYMQTRSVPWVLRAAPWLVERPGRVCLRCAWWARPRRARHTCAGCWRRRRRMRTTTRPQRACESRSSTARWGGKTRPSLSLPVLDWDEGVESETESLRTWLRQWPCEAAAASCGAGQLSLNRRGNDRWGRSG